MQKQKIVLHRIASVLFIIYALGSAALAACTYPAYNIGAELDVSTLWQFLLPVSVMLPLALFFSDLQVKKLSAASLISAFALSASVAAAPVIFKSSEGLDGAFFVGAAVMFFGAFSAGSLIGDPAKEFFEEKKIPAFAVTIIGLMTEAVAALFMAYCIVRGLLPNIALAFAILPLDAGLFLILIPSRLNGFAAAAQAGAVFVCSVFCVVYLTAGALISLVCLAAALTVSVIYIIKNIKISFSQKNIDK